MQIRKALHDNKSSLTYSLLGLILNKERVLNSREGKMSAKHVSTVVIAACFILVGATGLQEPIWKGIIECEDGIEVIKNPEEPLYGKITFDLDEDLTIGSEEDDNAYFYKGFVFNVDREGNIYVFDRASFRIQKFNRKGEYLQTIGQRGQGPGEFEDLFSMLFLDTECNLYVTGKRKIQVFNKKGEFVKSIPLDTDVSQFGMIGEENVLAETFSNNANGYIHEIIFLNSRGERVKTMAGLLSPRMDLKVKANIIFSHPYGQNIYFCVIDKDFGVYGNSSAYKLSGINSSGDLVHIIEKEEPP